MTGFIWWVIRKDGAEYICTLPDCADDVGAMTSYGDIITFPFEVIQTASLAETVWAEAQFEHHIENREREEATRATLEMRQEIEDAIVRPPYRSPIEGNRVFPTLEDQGWDFVTKASIFVRYVVTPDGTCVVGEPDERGILWRAGTAFVVEGGDEMYAREKSLAYITGCTVAKGATGSFRIARGYGQTPILIAR